MEFDAIRPILSGVIGGAIATWLAGRWAKRLPSHLGSKSREQLLHQHRTAVFVANALFFLGLCIGIALYPLGGFASTDWRPFGLGVGIASLSPLLALPLVSVLKGQSPRGAYVAFAWGQGSPLSVTYGLLGAGSVTFFWAAARLLGG